MTRRVAGRWKTEVLLAGVFLLVLSVLFWKLRIFDSGVNPRVEVGPIDLYIEHIPTEWYGYQILRSGHVPLWNPYQFCGEPFLAIPYAALFYPFHLVTLWVGVLKVVEMSLVFHMWLAGMGMWLLARYLRFASLGALAAALTFMWAGWMIHNNTLPTVFAAMSWSPLLALLVVAVCDGVPFAWLGLILALTCEILLGATEILVHVLYVGILFALWRLVAMTRQGLWRTALRRGAVACGCVLAAIGLAAPQLLPTIELVQQSTRAAGALTWAQVMYMGVMRGDVFLRNTLGSTGMAAVGVLPFMGIALVIGLRRARSAWIPAVIAAVVALLFVLGTPAYRLYFHIPVIGGLFRRPLKFLDIYAFGQALVAGLAVTRLQAWSDEGVAQLWRRPNWLGAVAIGLGGVIWMSAANLWNWYWLAILALILAFGMVDRRRLRYGIIVAVCAVQAAVLFFSLGDTHVRPAQRPEIFHTYDRLFDFLSQHLGEARVYLSRAFWFTPGLTPKQGMLHRVQVSIDYEPLAVGRYGEFFGYLSERHDPTAFYGDYRIGPQTHWRLMDLTGTKYFVMSSGEPGTKFMTDHPDEFRVAYAWRRARVFERRNVLPRTYVVSQSRQLSSAEAVLAELDSPAFDPRREVLFEQAVPPARADPWNLSAQSESRIVRYEPEHVEVWVHAKVPGFLILTDLFYPGWKAFVGDREVPIYRANYLFRAVRVEPGFAKVRFEYHPSSFRFGLAIAGLTCLMLAAALALSWRRMGRLAVAPAGGSDPP